jgi:hypothetical protein
MKVTLCKFSQTFKDRIYFQYYCHLTEGLEGVNKNMDSDWNLDKFLSITTATNCNHLKQILQQLIMRTGISIFISVGPRKPTLLAGPTNRLGSLGSRTPTKQMELLLHTWTVLNRWNPELLLTILMWALSSGLKCPRVGRKQITDRPWWSVSVDSLPWDRQSAACLVSAVAEN